MTEEQCIDILIKFANIKKIGLVLDSVQGPEGITKRAGRSGFINVMSSVHSPLQLLSLICLPLLYWRRGASTTALERALNVGNVRIGIEFHTLTSHTKESRRMLISCGSFSTTTRTSCGLSRCAVTHNANLSLSGTEKSRPSGAVFSLSRRSTGFIRGSARCLGRSPSRSKLYFAMDSLTPESSSICSGR